MSKKDKARTVYKNGNNPVFGLGLIGALIFYLQQAHSFGAVVVAFLKAVVWPAFFVHDVLKFIT